MKVYIVTRGEYSDYHIVGVFSTQEKAEQFVEDTYKVYGYRDSWDQLEIEEYPLDELKVNKNRQMYRFWHNFSGNTSSCRPVSTQHKLIREANNKHLDYKIMNLYGDETAIEIFIEADSYDKAVKIASDFKRQLIAENKIEL